MKAPDINSIARQSGVSIATVSRVLNNEHGVSAPVRRKTLAVMEMQGYRPRANAKRTTRLGLVLQSETPALEGFHCLVISGVFKYAAEQNIETTLIHYNRSVRGSSFVEYLRRKRCNGAVIVGPGDEDLSELSESRFPAMFVANRRDADGIGYIDCDGYNGTLLMMNYLLRLGHQKIGFIAGELSLTDHQERLAAYFDAMKEARLPVENGWVAAYEPGPTEQLGYEQTRKLLTRHPELTVIFANNDTSGWGAICGAVEMGRRVPEDLSVVGFDDHPISRFANPPLTTVRQPLCEMGYEAARSVDLKLKNKLAELPRRILTGELIVRRSCAPSPGVRISSSYATNHL